MQNKELVRICMNINYAYEMLQNTLVFVILTSLFI